MLEQHGVTVSDAISSDLLLLQLQFLFASLALNVITVILCNRDLHDKTLRDYASRSVFRYFSNLSVTACTSMGFARWSFMPHSRHFWISSEKASAVMAMIGISASSRSSPRMILVASYPSITGIRTSMRIAS